MCDPTTFRVSSQTPEKYGSKYTDYVGDGQTLKCIRNMDLYKDNRCSEILQASNFSTKSRLTKNNGFVNTVVDCYNHHHNLVLRPDDIWTAIMTQFSLYVNKHSEKFRNKFVSFHGKEELVVELLGTSLRSVSYSLFVKLMSKKIDEHLIDPEVKQWVLPSFSTTTDSDLVTCGVIFMSTMKNFFGYACTLKCGIPWVTLQGTVADWEDILKRIEKLREYELEDWYQMLKPILEQIVQAKKGSADVHFWNRICNYHPGGSGPSYISGWITAFCVFDKYGNWRGDRDSIRLKGNRLLKSQEPDANWLVVEHGYIPSGMVEVDVKIDDNGTEYNSVMIAGHMAFEIVNGDTLQPTIGWAICLKPLQPDDNVHLN